MFKKIYIPANVGIDVENGDYHFSMGDPVVAQAVALRTAKELAEYFDHNVSYGWPTVWSPECCLIYLPNNSGVLQMDNRTGADFVTVGAATERFIEEPSGGSFYILATPR